ncbi:MAG: virB4 protein [Candidatus Xenolissoclinum pacificiensis L6]|uniref:Type IV secretion system protein virB4 n=1 Tax=Candidatus Xenolissoclinum pacificiensis L6 TaxID=1401685 RepID=W2V052_9RICK|nr:MAG: virB4 protein [Candidatus Xenolissoclinum pacificiensis L6]
MVFSSVLGKEFIINREYKTGGFVPYLYQIDENTIVTKKKELMQVVKLLGYAFETADDDDVDIHKHARNQLFKNMSGGSFSLYYHVVRSKDRNSSKDFFSKRIPNYFAERVNRAWYVKNSTGATFKNDIYLTVIRKSDAQGVAALLSLYQKLSKGVNKDALVQDIKQMKEELEEVVTRVVVALRHYNPVVLGAYETEDGLVRSDLLGFLSKLMNCGGDESTPIQTTSKLCEYLPNARLYFGKKSIEILRPDGVYYGALVSVKEYGQNTSAGIMDSFLQLPYELVISQSFMFKNRQVAVNKMQIQQNRMIQTQDKAVSQIAEITKALDDAVSGKIAFGNHHLTVFCIAKSLKGLESAISLVDSELSNTGVYSIREKVNMEPAFWAQLPGNYDFIVRKSIISTLNLAGFCSMHNFPTGRPFGNFWGDAVTVFDTTSGTPFYFSFHVRDVGHTTIIGPTGAGKTVLMNFLCAQSMKFRPRIFFFDKDRGANIFISAVNGHYTIIEPRTYSGFNPLQLDDTPDNRTFLLEWFQQLVSVHSNQTTPEDIIAINSAIEGNYNLDKADRKLSNLVAFLGLEGGNSLAARIKMWHGDGSHALLFDNDKDTLDLESNAVFGFEMAHLLGDKASLPPVLTYLFHRINISLDGSPTMIVLDEAWALIDNPIFAPKIKDWLKVLRKLNTFVIFATQSVEDASKSSISDTLIQQTATQIFLPNLKATDVYRDVFMLSKREYVLIKNTDPASRFFLIKQGVDAVVARINLRGMDDIINILSGTAESVLIMDEVRKEHGDDPKVWISIFLDKLKRR